MEVMCRECAVELVIVPMDRGQELLPLANVSLSTIYRDVLLK